MKSFRSKRLNVELKRELSKILQSELRAAIPALTTITEVRLTPDLRLARVYFSVLGSENDKSRVQDVLDKSKGHIRSLIASRITMRFHPSLEFRLDNTLDYAQRIEDLIEQTHQEQSSNQSPSETGNP
jgi:ribosome-binding factor A